MRLHTADRPSPLCVLLTNLAEGQREHEEISRPAPRIQLDYLGYLLIRALHPSPTPRC
jgi:hypothetical protein